MNCVLGHAVVAGTLLLTGGQAVAQAASGDNLFLVAHETEPGGRCTSTTFTLAASIGAAVPAGRATSSAFVLEAGLPPVLDLDLLGGPWVTGVRPLLGPLRGGTPIVVHGAELDLGPLTTLTIGGQPATVSSRTRSQLTAVLPPQPAPGWKDLAVANDGGAATLVVGAAVIPLLDRPRAILVGQPFRLTYQGVTGDVVVWAAAAGNGTLPLPLPPFWHALELDLGTVVILTTGIVTDPAGTMHLDVPAIHFRRPLHVQALVAQTMHAGYAPGAFTNVIRL